MKLSEEDINNLKIANTITKRIEQLFKEEEEFYGFGLALNIKRNSYESIGTKEESNTAPLLLLEKRIYCIMKSDISKKEEITAKLQDCFEMDMLDLKIDITSAGWKENDLLDVTYYRHENNMKKIEKFLIGERLTKKLEANYLLESLVDKQLTKTKKIKI